ncbi:hypothetical protein D5S17_02035 [Pseudonocardiaceae bacterium YIM PH 21723]|nr:hypothetical protein D5S17_02035 [Pseudonocardiaceae bacterium YIM PH 21723]
MCSGASGLSPGLSLSSGVGWGWGRFWLLSKAALEGETGLGPGVFPAGVLGGGTPFWWGWAASAGDLKDAIVYLSALKASFVYLG